ncbi:MAG: hypothetical protein L0Z50_07515 [Verrucomicrobiales bacterium]|nr:hypothetical protein [Verrucomicrobiales bacterium]
MSATDQIVREFIFTAACLNDAAKLLNQLEACKCLVSYDCVHGHGVSEGGVVVMAKVIGKTLIGMRWKMRQIEGDNPHLMVQTVQEAGSYTGVPDETVTEIKHQYDFGLLPEPKC